MLMDMFQIIMVATNAGSDGQLELLSFLQTLTIHIGGMEWSGDENIGIRQMSVKFTVGRLLVVSNNVGMAFRF